MPTLSLRTIGVSYLIEGLGPSGLDADALLDDLAATLGPAVAPYGKPSEPGGPVVFDALLVDRKAASWDDLRDRLAAWVRGRGGRAALWTESGSAAARRAVLEFDA